MQNPSAMFRTLKAEDGRRIKDAMKEDERVSCDVEHENIVSGRKGGIERFEHQVRLPTGLPATFVSVGSLDSWEISRPIKEHR